MQSAAILTFGLSKTYPSSGRGIRSISLRVEPGEVLGLVGPPGSGKSTLIKVLATRLRAQHGSFLVMGCRVPSYRWSERALLDVRRQIGVLLDDAPHYGDLTGLDNLRLHGRLHKLPRAEAERRIDLLLHLTGLDALAPKPVRQWGYSARRRLALAQALLHKPAVLLLDEPDHGLDGAMQAALRSVLASVTAAGTAVVWATKDPDSARSLCTTALLLHEGQVATIGNPSQVLAQAGRAATIIVRLALPGPAPNLAQVDGLLGCRHDGACLSVRVADPEVAIGPLVAACQAAGLRLTGLEVRRDTPWEVMR